MISQHPLLFFLSGLGYEVCALYVDELVEKSEFSGLFRRVMWEN